MKILVTGAAGFLGSAIVRLAVERGHDVRAFVRRADAPGIPGLDSDACEIVLGDMTRPETMPAAVAGANAIVHCAATTSEGAPDYDLSYATNVRGTVDLLRAAEAAGAPSPRWIQISSMSAHPASSSVYGRTKLAADEAVRASALPWTILRPAIVYGPGGRGLVAKTAALMEKLPVVPVVGDGRQSVRPAFVGDVARAVLACLASPATVGKSYMLGSRDDVSFDDFLRELARSRGLRRPLVHLPIPAAMAIARTLALLTKNPPLTPDNVLGVKEALKIEIEPAVRDFGFDPCTFREGLEASRSALSPR